MSKQAILLARSYYSCMAGLALDAHLLTGDYLILQNSE
jgi:hypothetical protein